VEARALSRSAERSFSSIASIRFVFSTLQYH
jgi:hypothetical protein